MTTLALIALALNLTPPAPQPKPVLDAPAWACSTRPLEQGSGNVRVCAQVKP